MLNVVNKISLYFSFLVSFLIILTSKAYIPPFSKFVTDFDIADSHYSVFSAWSVLHNFASQLDVVWMN